MTTVLTRDTFSAGLISQGPTTVPTPTNSTDAATKGYVDGEAVPVGGMVLWPASPIPTGWVQCNGNLVGRTAYPELFAVIGTTYGAGDGSTTFALPMARAMLAVGASFIVRYYIIKY